MKSQLCCHCSRVFIPVKDGIYCSPKCYRQWWQNELKKTNPKAYRERLDAQNKRRRDAVRKRRNISLDSPRLTLSGRGYKVKDGYRYILKKGHPNSAKSGYVAEHVFLMTQHLGRPLRKGETIHHKNGIRDDNRIENLELWVNTIRFGQRLEDKIAYYKEFLESYGYKIILKKNTQPRGEQ